MGKKNKKKKKKTVQWSTLFTVRYIRICVVVRTKCNNAEMV